jgi:hypothetical protein
MLCRWQDILTGGDSYLPVGWCQLKAYAQAIRISEADHGAYGLPEAAMRDITSLIDLVRGNGVCVWMCWSFRLRWSEWFQALGRFCWRSLILLLRRWMGVADGELEEFLCNRID